MYEEICECEDFEQEYISSHMKSSWSEVASYDQIQYMYINHSNAKHVILLCPAQTQ